MTIKLKATKAGNPIEGTYTDLGECDELDQGIFYIGYFNFQRHAFLSRTPREIIDLARNSADMRMTEDIATLEVHGYSSVEIVND